VALPTQSTVTVGKKDVEYEGWIWVSTQNGKQGWAPVQYLRLQQCNRAIACRDYSARELDTRVGDEVVLHFLLNDWGWVENRNGVSGWVPMKTIDSA